MNLKEVDKKSKELLDSKYDDFYLNTNRILSGLQKYIKYMGFKDDVNISIEYDILENDLEMSVSVDDIGVITSRQMYKLTEGFKQEFGNRLNYYIVVEESGNLIGGDYEFGESYTISDNSYQVKDKSQKEFNKKYWEILGYSELIITLNYDNKLKELKGSVMNFIQDKDKFKVLSKYLSSKINLIENLYDSKLSDRINGSINTSIINNEINQVKDYFNKELQSGRFGESPSGILNKVAYSLSFKNGWITLDVVVEGFNLDYNYLNNKSYLKDFNLEINNIGVNVILFNKGLISTISGFSDKVARKDSVVQQTVKSDIALEYMRQLDEKLQPLTVDEFTVANNFGTLIIDITNLDLIDEDELIIPREYDWATSTGVAIGDSLLLYLYVSDGGARDISDSKIRELNKKLTKENIIKIIGLFKNI